jgi:hypothetical protein
VELTTGKKTVQLIDTHQKMSSKEGDLETYIVIRKFLFSSLHRMSLHFKYRNLAIKRKMDIRTTLWLAPRLNPAYSGSRNLINYLPRAKVRGVTRRQK